MPTQFFSYACRNDIIVPWLWHQQTVNLLLFCDVQEMRALRLKNEDLAREAEHARRLAERERVDARVRCDEARGEMRRLDVEMSHAMQAHERDLQEVIQ